MIQEESDQDAEIAFLCACVPVLELEEHYSQEELEKRGTECTKPKEETATLQELSKRAEEERATAEERLLQGENAQGG